MRTAFRVWDKNYKDILVLEVKERFRPAPGEGGWNEEEIDIGFKATMAIRHHSRSYVHFTIRVRLLTSISVSS